MGSEVEMAPRFLHWTHLVLGLLVVAQAAEDGAFAAASRRGRKGRRHYETGYKVGYADGQKSCEDTAPAPAPAPAGDVAAKQAAQPAHISTSVRSVLGQCTNSSLQNGSMVGTMTLEEFKQEQKGAAGCHPAARTCLPCKDKRSCTDRKYSIRVTQCFDCESAKAVVAHGLRGELVPRGGGLITRCKLQELLPQLCSGEAWYTFLPNSVRGDTGVCELQTVDDLLAKLHASSKDLYSSCTPEITSDAIIAGFVCEKAATVDTYVTSDDMIGAIHDTNICYKGYARCKKLGFKPLKTGLKTTLARCSMVKTTACRPASNDAVLPKVCKAQKIARCISQCERQADVFKWNPAPDAHNTERDRLSGTGKWVSLGKIRSEKHAVFTSIRLVPDSSACTGECSDEAVDACQAKLALF